MQSRGDDISPKKVNCQEIKLSILIRQIVPVSLSLLLFIGVYQFHIKQLITLIFILTHINFVCVTFEFKKRIIFLLDGARKSS